MTDIPKGCVVAATKNKNKLREMNAILEGCGLSIISQEEAGLSDIDVVEDGETFEENSFKKANEIMKACRHPAIADDSGLMVDALGGAPGVYSARFAGEGHDDSANNTKLLSMLQDVPDEKRGAKFVAVITLVYPDGEKIVARGECPGHIMHELSGVGGFGYDPLFRPEGYEQTFGELGADIKNKISHRARALAELERKLACRKQD